MSSVEAETNAKPVSRWEDTIDVFFAPADLFARRRHERALPALITLIVLGIVAYYVLMPANGIVMRASVPPEAAGTPGAERFITIMSYLGGVMVAITHFVTVLLAAILLWLVARGVELRPSFRQTMLIATYAGFIYLLMQIVTSVAAMIHGDGLDPTRDLSFGLLRFLDSEALPRALPPLLRRTDIFLLWQAVIWAVGVRVVLGATKVQAALVAVGAWLLAAIPGMLWAAFGPTPPTA